MRPRLFLFLWCLCVAGGASAQERQSISLTLGPSLPLGSFASQDGQNPGAGLATVGGALGLSYQHRVGKGPFSLSAEVRVRLNPINEDANLAYPKSLDTGYVYTVTKKSWEAGGLFAGANYRVTLVSKLQLELGLSIGVVEAVRPALYATGVRPSALYAGSQDYRVVNANEVKVVTPSVLPKAGLVYPLTTHFSLTVHAAFCYLRPTFKNVSEVVASTEGLIVPGIYRLSNSMGPTFVYGQTHTIMQSMYTLDLDAGLALRL